MARTPKKGSVLERVTERIVGEDDDEPPVKATEAEVMQGHPGTGSPPVVEPDLIDLDVGGKKYKVSKEVAGLYSTQAAELDALKKRLPTVTLPPSPPPPAAAADEQDIEDLLFRDPKKAASLIEDRAVKRATESLRGEYNQEQLRKEFWSDFYKSNPDLQGQEDIVDTVLRSNWTSLEQMKGAEAIDKLGELTKDRILKLTGGVAPRGRKNATQTLEGGTKEPPASPGSEGQGEARKEVIPRSLSAAIRARARTRLSARTKSLI